MKTIFNYLALAIVIYFGVNWVADNPKMMKAVRTKMNAAVSAGSKQIKKAAGEIKQSI